MEISPEDGDEISGIPIQLGTMVCIKKNTVRKLHITSAVSGADPTTWYAEDPVAWTGCPAQWSITQTPYGVVFLGWDHWYLFDGSVARPIIDEFDTKDVLNAGYSDVVGFYHGGVMLAAYPDKTIANQYHDRVMRYNFKREALSYDEWTGTQIKGANCFAAKTGDDETGELYYGDSQLGIVVKEKESQQDYRLKTKTECLAGEDVTGTTDVFVGGTEAVPFIEIGSTTSASAIPDDVIIFWDQTGTTPGDDWTEITATYSEYFIKIASSSSTAAASTHRHSCSGSLSSVTPSMANSGDQNSTQGLLAGHGHSWSGYSNYKESEPRHIRLRMFKSSSATNTEFPDGAIVMWDQAAAPTGWETLANEGYYVKAYATSLGSPVSSDHSHTVSATSSNHSDNGNGSPGSTCAAAVHNHSVSGTLSSKNTDDWELDYAQLHMIKKVGESDTWDGTSQFVMCLVSGTAAPTGWTNVSTYNGMYLKVGATTASTGSAANATHTHTIPSGTSETNSQTWGTTYHRTQCRVSHSHPFSGTAANGTLGAPKTASFKLYKFELGKMRDYNAAIATHQGTGTWVSPTMEIDSESLSKLYWNETVASGDTIKLYFKTGATSNACTAAAWGTALEDPNGSAITATADVWAQYKIDFTAADTTTANPKVYFTNGFVTKYTYLAGSTNAETSVNWKYAIGWRNFDEPMIDKIFKKIATAHKGDTGSFTVEWETENDSGSFVVDLTTYTKRWDSFFPSNAMGKEMNFTFYKNDLYDFQLKEVKGLYSPQELLL